MAELTWMSRPSDMEGVKVETDFYTMSNESVVVGPVVAVGDSFFTSNLVPETLLSLLVFVAGFEDDLSTQPHYQHCYSQKDVEDVPRFHSLAAVVDACFSSARIPLRNLIDTYEFVGGDQNFDRKGDFFVDLPLPLAGSLVGVFLIISDHLINH